MIYCWKWNGKWTVNNWSWALTSLASGENASLSESHKSVTVYILEKSIYVEDRKKEKKTSGATITFTAQSIPIVSVTHLYHILYISTFLRWFQVTRWTAHVGLVHRKDEKSNVKHERLSDCCQCGTFSSAQTASLNDDKAKTLLHIS